ncbi:MAG: HAD-IA family hydrolase [Nitrospinae bacterium]|nr:HAD-IA family hydrolase [Nitrospinota bacterium]
MISADALCFDLDGTLIDSAEDLIQATIHSLHGLGIDPPPPEVIIGYVGGGARGLLQGSLGEAATPERLEAGLAAFIDYYGAHLLDHTLPYPGVEEVLRHFFATRPLAVITNKPEAFSRTILEGLGLAGYFREILGYDSVERKKPHPEGILQVLQGWGAEPTRAVMVGDSDHDILAGKAAGTVTVAVAYGFKPPEELASLGPDYLIHDIRELIALVTP